MANRTLLCRQSARARIAGRPCAVTLGNFDGLHRGHQELLRAVREEKDKLGPDALSVLISFHPHPGVVLGKAPRLPLITSPRQKLLFMRQFDIDIFHVIRFTKDFAQLSAQQFIDEILIERLNARTLVIGPDARVGHKREGTPEFIRAAMERQGRRCREVPFLYEGGDVISSRRIRALIEQGCVAEAAALLGRPFAYSSLVIRGDQRGRTLGFPTANLLVNRQVLPKAGVYGGFADTPAGTFPFVGNIGMRPTFSGQRLQVEVHLLGYYGPELYGQRVEARFTTRIRDEQKFGSVDELKVQIERDIASARAALQGKLS